MNDLEFKLNSSKRVTNMTTLNQDNIILVVGDLGSGVNFIKNVLLLGNNTDWPAAKGIDRMQYFFNEIYPLELKDHLTHWGKHEYKLRNFKSKYGVDTCDTYNDINTPQVIDASNTSKIIFFTHWVDIANKLKTLYPAIKIVSVSAHTEFEVLWQIKTYIDKFGIDRLHNFSFELNIADEKEQFISNYGLEEYYKFNVLNMFEILKQRAPEYNIGYNIPIASLLEESISSITAKLVEHTGSLIDIDRANMLHTRWKNLHHPVDWVYNCTWFEKILK